MWKLPTTASYQPMNAVLALEAMKRLVKEPTASWRKILETTSWKGRMEEALPGIVTGRRTQYAGCQSACEKYPDAGEIFAVRMES